MSSTSKLASDDERPVEERHEERPVEERHEERAVEARRERRDAKARAALPPQAPIVVVEQSESDEEQLEGPPGVLFVRRRRACSCQPCLPPSRFVEGVLWLCRAVERQLCAAQSGSCKRG